MAIKNKRLVAFYKPDTFGNRYSHSERYSILKVDGSGYSLRFHNEEFHTCHTLTEARDHVDTHRQRWLAAQARNKRDAVAEQAGELHDWLQGACNDIGAAYQQDGEVENTPDALWDDSELLKDMLGDRVYNMPKRTQVLEALFDYTGNEALQTAIIRLL